MAEHTKGPWSVAPYRTLNRNTHVILPAESHAEPPTVAVITHCVNDSANARLVAAAPALLAACEGMLHHIDDVLDDQDLMQRRAALVAAIATAKGGA